MKPTCIIVLLGMLTFLGTNLQAQIPDQSLVKILPTTNRDVLKVIYARQTTEPVKVRFITTAGVVGSDKIKGSYPNGISKRYDVGNINDHDFWIEISSPEVTVTYRIIPTKGKQVFEPHLEKVTYIQDLVTANR